MPLPRLFIGSSAEGRPIADAIQASLKHVCNSTVWHQGVFEPGKGYLESLTNEVQKYDFGVLVFTPDDRTESRNAAFDAPRDNVLIELGLFIGAIGRSRTFAVCQEDANIKIPSDLAGVSLVPFGDPKESSLLAAVGPACFTITGVIQSLGSRQISATPSPRPISAQPRGVIEIEVSRRTEAAKDIVGVDAEPPSLDLWYSQIRPVLHQSATYTTPTYWLDANLSILDWNPAFDLIFSEITPLLRYRHVNDFIARLANYEAVFNHGRAFTRRVHAGQSPTCDTETLLYRSSRYGDVAMLKVAAQLHDSDGNLKGWAVSLLPRQLDWDSFQRDLESRISEVKLWEGYAPSYDKILLGFPPYQQLLRDVASAVPDTANKVLDGGSGSGNIADLLLRRGFDVTSLEPNAAMISKMRERRFDPIRHKVLKASAEDLEKLRGIENCSFDAVTLSNVLYCVDDPFACLTGIHRVLKPDGMIGLSTTHEGVSLDRLLAAIKRYLVTNGTYEKLRDDYDRVYESNKTIERTIARRVSADKYRQMVKAAGFEITRDEEFTYEGAVMLLHARRK
jgi:ubiquinone/menaquinone biosynthesis C-methylase UbiE